MYLTTVKLVLRNSFDLNYLRKMCGTWAPVLGSERIRRRWPVGAPGRGGWAANFTVRNRCNLPRRAPTVSGDTNSDPLPPVLIPTPIMPSCYRLSTPLSGSFLVFTSVSRWVCSGLTFVNLDRINPLLRFSRSR